MKNPRLSAFYKYIFSSILSTFGYSCYVLVDTIVLAQVSDFAIAALNIVLPAYQLILAVGSMIGIGASTHYAILRAEKKLKDGSMYFTIAMISGTIFAASATILMITFRTPLLIALGANSETLKLASDYLIGYVLLAVFNVASIVITGFIRCDGAPRLAGTASLVGSLSNILLDVVFVYGLRWGMFGAAFGNRSFSGCDFDLLLPVFYQKAESV